MKVDERRQGLLSLEELHAKLDYDPDTGIFKWKVPVKRRPKDGIAGSEAGGGYLSIQIDNKSFLSHRLAWFYSYGEWPNQYIDHINGDRKDNRISNLRQATFAENSRNRKRKYHNKSGIKGVSFCKQTGKWRAGIQVSGVEKNLGRYPTKEAAAEAYRNAATKHHGDFASYDL